MSPPTSDQIKRIVGTLNERGQFRSLISLASTPAYQNYEGMLENLYRVLGITKVADQKHIEAFYSIRRSKINAPYNRYRDIYAFDRTAVRIPNDLNKWIRTGKVNGVAGNGTGVGDVEELSEEDSGYLNANVIADGKGSWWVACQVCLIALHVSMNKRVLILVVQAPLPTTFHPFLMAILTRSATFKHAHLFGRPPQQKLKESPPKTAIIVQLTGLFEGTVAKADQYLPYVLLSIRQTHSNPHSCYRTKIGRSIKYDAPNTIDSHPPIQLTLESTTHLPKTSSTLSTLTLSLASPESELSIPPMTVHHYAYEGWPDFGVPQGKDVDKLIELIKEVEAKQEAEAGGCEVWVHW